MSSLGEFDLIRQLFQRPQAVRRASLGIGDDCALLPIPAGEELAISTDMLVAGRHFFDDVDPYTLGHKTLAVNLSDLAAMGAQPLSCTLAVALPALDSAWLERFTQGLWDIAGAHHCELIGGDTTRGPLTLNVTVLGSVPPALALRRSAAQVGDDIWVSHAGSAGGIGDARLALQALLQQRGMPHTLPPSADAALLLSAVRHRLELPQPRVALGLALRGVAHAALDLSDGLAGDINHILQASHVGATLFADDGQQHGLLHATSPTLRALGADTALQFALEGGDDYELLFTAAPTQRAQVAHIAHQVGLQLTRIGQIEATVGTRWRNLQGVIQPLHLRSFDHFATP